MHKYLLLITTLITLLSCKREEEAYVQQDWVYTGLTLNSYRIYEVNEIKYNFGLSFEIKNDTLKPDSIIPYVVYTAGVDTSTYYIKDTVIEKIVDLEGDSVFVIHTYRSDDPNLWKEFPDSISTAKLDYSKYIRIDNNRPVVKLTFPILLGSEWDMNAMNIKEKDIISYAEVRSNFEYDDKTFDDVVKVEHEYRNDSSTVQDIIDVRLEYYVPHAGLIYRENSYYINKQENGEFAHDSLFIIDEGHHKIEKLIELGL